MRIDSSLMASEKQQIAFWLMPSSEAEPYFVSLVEELARRLHAPLFEPHVTLQGAKLDEEQALAVMEEIAARSSPVDLEIAGFEFSEIYTKTLYVQFRASAAATALSDAIAEKARSCGGYHFDPHLSLVYKRMTKTEQEALAREVRIPFGHVRCDRLKAVSVPSSIEGPEDVHAWRVLGEQLLGEGSK